MLRRYIRWRTLKNYCKWFGTHLHFVTLTKMNNLFWWDFSDIFEFFFCRILMNHSKRPEGKYLHDAMKPRRCWSSIRKSLDRFQLVLNIFCSWYLYPSFKCNHSSVVKNKIPWLIYLFPTIHYIAYPLPSLLDNLVIWKIKNIFSY
jgi:hypothetical protein